MQLKANDYVIKIRGVNVGSFSFILTDTWRWPTGG